MNSEQPSIKDNIQLISFVVGAAIISGLFIVAYQQYGKGSPIAVLWSLACLMAGSFIGFLFGIPRILQNDTTTHGATAAAKAGNNNTSGEQPSASSYRANTNLDQISDWLTKIVVGVGLINLQKVPPRLDQAATYIAHSFGGDGNKFFAGAMIIYFSIVGFLGAYLITRIYLAGVFEDTDPGNRLRSISDGAKHELVISDLSDPRRINLGGAAEQTAQQILDVPFEQLSSLTDIIAWSKAQFNAKNYEKAIAGYDKAVQTAPADVQLRLEYTNALYYAGKSATDDTKKTQFRAESERQLLKAYELVQNSSDLVTRMKVYRGLTFYYLYNAPPSGFENTIKYGKEYASDANPRKIQSSGIWVNLACAYGQQWKWLKEKENADQAKLDAARDDAFNAAQEALKLDAKQIWLNRLRTLLQKNIEKDPTDNDLEVFENDEKFRKLLGLPDTLHE